MLDKIQKIEIPFHRTNRTVPRYEHRASTRTYREGKGYVYYPNCAFDDSFKITEFLAKTKSHYAMVRSTISGALYPMQWYALKDLIFNGNLIKGHFKGTFTFTYKWKYFGIHLFDRQNSTEEIKGPFWWDQRPIYVIENDSRR